MAGHMCSTKHKCPALRSIMAELQVSCVLGPSSGAHRGPQGPPSGANKFHPSSVSTCGKLSHTYVKVRGGLGAVGSLR